ncbi:unnamed protein product [Paramecium sonneborni]|nr:unnamed protein product [Paramecium sonneborni]
MFSKDENEQFHHYQGNFLNEKRHGKGTYIWKANEQNEIARYSGFWQNNQYHGYGTLTLKEENIIIEGEFSFGQPVFQKCQIKGPNLPQQTLKDYVMKEQTKKSEENIIPKQQFNVNQFFQPTQNLQQFQKKFNEPFNSNGFPFNPNNQAQYSRDFQNNQNAFNQNNYFKK